MGTAQKVTLKKNKTYFVFESAIIAWRNSLLFAKLQGGRPDFPEYEPHWFLAQPLVKALPPFTFAIHAKAPKLDNYATGTEMDLYSIRLINLLREAGVKFETFPVTLIARKTKEVLPLHYEIFHLLEMYPAIEKQLPRGLILTEACLRSKRLLFRPEEQENLVLIHHDLKEKLEEAEITGCQYTPVQEFDNIFLDKEF
jgi:hypothetical protein